MLLGSYTYWYDILSVAKAKGNNIGDMGSDIGKDVGDMGDTVNDMDGILSKAIYCNIVEIRDTDIVHGDTSIVIR